MVDAFPACARPCFTVDASLIKLGKYLRCAGYDCTWDETEPARVLAARAQREGRVFVTRSTRVGFEFERPAQCVQIELQLAPEQFRELVRALDLDVERWAFTRCIRCNVELDDVDDPRSIRARVPRAVFELHEKFFTCPRCATVFWHGSHVENTRRKLGFGER